MTDLQVIEDKLEKLIKKKPLGEGEGLVDVLRELDGVKDKHSEQMDKKLKHYLE